MLELFDKIQESVAFIKQQWDVTPHAGIILGTGLGPLVTLLFIFLLTDTITKQQLLFRTKLLH